MGGNRSYADGSVWLENRALRQDIRVLMILPNWSEGATQIGFGNGADVGHPKNMPR
jgi:hypothetical protein